MESPALLRGGVFFGGDSVMDQKSNLLSGNAVGSFWLLIWAAFLALGWLLPNRYWPWTSFQTDYWVAFFLSLMCVTVVSVSKHKLPWHGVTVFAFFLPLIPLAQYGFGLIYFAGDALLSFLFLAGFAFAVLTGSRWETLHKNQAIDGLFLAIGIAAIGSVGMQLCQWLGLDILGIWLMPGGANRPFANFAQPNNLATFLLWGVLACAWGYSRGVLGARIAMLAAIFMVFGIALTQSRTAVIGLLIVIALLFYWREKEGACQLFRASLMLLLALILSLVLIPIIFDTLLLGFQDSRFSDVKLVMRDDARMTAYRIFLDASLHQPWFGYGWFNLGEAFFSSVDSYPALGMVFQHSHNLFLDLVLWVGWPLGILLICALLVWMFRAFRAVDSAEKVILFAFISVIGWHAMVEFPLHYASFLFPSALVMGVFEAKIHPGGVFLTRRWPCVLIFAVALLGLGAVGWDYLRVEENARSLRFERLSIGTNQASKVPDLLILTQLEAFLKFSRVEPRAGLSDEDLSWARFAATGVYNPLNMLNFIEILALNGHVEEARLWVKKMQKSLPDADFKAMSNDWAQHAVKYPELLAVVW